MKAEKKQIAVQDEEVIINMRISKCVYNAWKGGSEYIGVSMVEFLEVLIMYSPSKENLIQKWPWYAGYPEEVVKKTVSE